jgi:glycosyltransferase involved in cell wall biosynthesis
MTVDHRQRRMKVSVIVTVKNEEAAIQTLLDSLYHQILPPDEVVICDGGSTDGTLAVAREFARWLPIKLVEAPGSNISAGRNRAIAAASGPVIASTDAGVMLSPSWLASITEPIRAGRAAVVGGWFEPDPYTDFEVAMGATVLPELSDIEAGKFLPSSRSIAFLKSAWEAAGGYPEWLDYCEDLVFDLALRERIGAFAFAPRAVAHFRPRGSLRSFFRQYYLYARGDGKANLWLKRHLIRYGTYLVALPLLLRMIWRGKRLGWLGLFAGGFVYCLRPAQRLWPQTSSWRLWPRVRVFALIPIIRLVGDAAKMIGYPVGVWWRFRRGRAP